MDTYSIGSIARNTRIASMSLPAFMNKQQHRGDVFEFRNMAALGTPKETNGLGWPARKDDIRAQGDPHAQGTRRLS